MKQTIKLLALLLMPLFIISSCIEDKMIQGVTASSDAKSLYLSANYITTSYESSKTSVTVKASNGVGWEIIDIPSWVTVSPSRGTGPGTVTVYFSENTSTSRRRQVMQLITTDNDWMANIRLEVVQNGKPNEPVDPVDPNTYEGVDLGLSVLWASYNVGAESPESYGNYYAWGETYTKSQYDWSNYSWCAGSENTLTKYCLYADYGNNGFTDGKYILEEQDDVAHVLWGDKWRTPSREEFDELLSYCNWEDETLNGVNGYRVTSQVEGYEGRSIFLPCAGSIVGDELEYGEYGVYWVNSISTGTNTYASLFYGVARSANYMYPRYAGMSVRPVAQSDTWPGITSISISKSATSVTVNGTVALTAFLWSGSRDYSFMFDAEWESADNNIATVNQQGIVTGISPGGVVIRASYNGMVAVCVVDVYEYTPVTDYVDLGLSVNWATCNLGAMSPEQYGNYYAWGETTVKDVYNWTTYALSNGSGATLTRYCNDSEHGLDGYTDEEIYLLPEDDAAYVMLNGYGNFRMPTKDEFDELIDNCTWTLSEMNGVEGYLVTSRVSGFEGNSIFLPLSGYRSGSTMYSDVLNYWSSQLFQNNCIGAWCLGERSGVVTMSGYTRALGGSIRPVIPSTTWTPTPVQYSSEYVDMGLSVKWASCNLGATTPDGYGNYYAWGETQPKKEYYWTRYTWGGSTTTLTKYNTDGDRGTVDNLTVLEQADDAAYATLGEGWRIPTISDYEELLNNCSWTWTEMNGHYGYRVTAPNMNSIFLPAAGSYGANYMGEKSQAGYYWSNALNLSGTDCAWSLAFSESERGKDYVTGRAVCASIRPVYEEPVGSNTYSYTEYKQEVLNTDNISIVVKDYYDDQIHDWVSPRIVDDPYNEANKCFLVTTVPNPEEIYINQFMIVLDESFKAGDMLHISMRLMADQPLQTTTEVHTVPGNNIGYTAFTAPQFTTSWQTFEFDYTLNYSDDRVFVLNLSMQNASINCYLDDISIEVSAPFVPQYYDYATYKADVVKSSNVDIKVKEYVNDEVVSNVAPRVMDDVLDHENKCIVLSTKPNTTTDYESELYLFLDPLLEEGAQVSVTMRIRADKSQTISRAVILDGDGVYKRSVSIMDASFTTNWTNFTFETTASEGDGAISFCLVKLTGGNTLYFDDIDIQVSGNYHANHAFVDLGLSVKWATCNVGASKPEGYGDYFAWGETDVKTNYTASNYVFWQMPYKYMMEQENVWRDDKSVLESIDDVAQVTWNGNWRMPTWVEMEELRDSCTWVYTTRKGVNGFLITSNISGYTDKQIFLPAGGGYKESLENESSYGEYWSSSLYTNDGEAYCLSINQTDNVVGFSNHDNRYNGKTVRAVCP